MFVIVILFLTLAILTYDSFRRTNDSLAIGVVRIIVVLLDIGFLIGLLLYSKIKSVGIVLFCILLPLYLFMVVYGADIPIIVKIAIGLLFIIWFRNINKNKY